MMETGTIPVNNIYDLMAFSYKKILEDERFDINKMRHNQKFHKLFLIYIENKNSNLFKAFLELKKSLEEYDNSEPFTSEDFYNIILEIDSCEIYIFKSYCCYDSYFKTYNGLNTYLKEEIKIYPNLESTYIDFLNQNYKKEIGCQNDFLRERKHYNNSSLNNKLKNFIIYKPEDFNSYNIYFHELYEFKEFTKDKEKLKIVLFPTTCTDINEIFDVEYTKEKKFCIKEMFPSIEQKLLERYKSFINTLDDDIDFLIFPEMLMTQKILDDIKELIIEKGIKFVFCGSTWKNKNNICSVLYEGELLFNYNKKVPFEIKYNKKQLLNLINTCKNQQQKKILESILRNHNFFEEDQVIFEELLNKDDEMHIIDINTFGRIATFICRDIDDDSFINISKLLLNDFIILPACSPSMDLCNNAEHLADRYHSTTIMCNTCSALCHGSNDLKDNINNEKTIGFITTPSKSGTKRNHKNVLYVFNDTCLECKKNCLGRKYYIGLKKLHVEEDIICLNVEEIKR